jgi:mono/diheme cytochrome c family protein
MKLSVLMMTATLLLTGSAASGADDAAAIYKRRCSGCHGATGEGKSAMKAPALKGTKLEESQIIDHLLKGEPASKPPHNKGISGMTEAQAKAIAAYVKTFK